MGDVEICHLNAQSIPAHFSELQALFSNQAVDACMISESWLKPSLPSSLYNLPGYNLIRNDRTARRGGGVAIYLKDHFSYEVICKSSVGSSPAPEYLLIRVTMKDTSILLGVFYIAPDNNNYFDELENVLHEHLPNFPHALFFGDLNTCLLKQNRKSSKLTRLMSSLNLSLLPLQATHHSGNSHSWLDLIIASNPHLINFLQSKNNCCNPV